MDIVFVCAISNKLFSILNYISNTALNQWFPSVFFWRLAFLKCQTIVTQIVNTLQEERFAHSQEHFRLENAESTLKFKRSTYGLNNTF